MAPQLADWLVLFTGAYFSVGIFFAFLFAFSGVGAVDAKARDSGWGFRLLIVPGAAALWPLLLRRWLAASGVKESR